MIFSEFEIQIFNEWYFLFLLLSAGAIVGLYFTLRKSSPRVQFIVLFSLLALGFLLHFVKMFIPPYADYTDGFHITERGWRDSWFVNICGANIALFMFFFLTKNKYLYDYMFYIGVISGAIALFYPEEPMAKGDAIEQSAQILDILRFYYHHWMLLAVPLLTVLLKRHRLSYKRIWVAPVGLLLLMLFIVLNQILQSELGFVPLRDGDGADGLNVIVPNYKNTSYIWGPLEISYGSDGPKVVMSDIGQILSYCCPNCFKFMRVPVLDGGTVTEYITIAKYWPWFWLIVPVFTIVTPISFGLVMIFDHKAFLQNFKSLFGKTKVFFKSKIKHKPKK